MRRILMAAAVVFSAAIAQVAVPAEPARAQNPDGLDEMRTFSGWSLGYKALEGGPSICTVVQEAPLDEALSFFFISGDSALYVSFAADPAAGLAAGDDVSFGVAFEIGAERQESSAPLSGFIEASQAGLQFIFLIDPQATEIFKRADAVAFDYSGVTSRFVLAGSRRALDALEDCARQRF